MNGAGRKAARYMGFAEECMRLIDRMPQHAQPLTEMAAAWLELAHAELKRQPAAENAKPPAPDLVE